MLIIEKHITKMGIGPLCKLFGKSRQAFYNRKELRQRVNTSGNIILLIKYDSPWYIDGQILATLKGNFYHFDKTGKEIFQ